MEFFSHDSFEPKINRSFKYDQSEKGKAVKKKSNAKYYEKNRQKILDFQKKLREDSKR